jgi:hypothetical protein
MYPFVCSWTHQSIASLITVGVPKKKGDMGVTIGGETGSMFFSI